MARQLHEFGQRAHAVDADGLHRREGPLLRIDHQQLETHEIGVLACDRVAATGAFAAGKTVRARRLAQQRLGKIERQRMLADAARSVHEQRMWPACAPRQRRAGGIELPGQQRQPRQAHRLGGALARHPSQSQRRQVGVELGAHHGHRPRAVDDPEPPRLGGGALEVRIAHPREKGARFALEPVEGATLEPGRLEPRARDARSARRTGT